MIELQGDSLVFRFPEIHENAECHIDFQRTLRIPDDNRDYPLPPGLGRFPLTHVRQAKHVSMQWHEHGGVMLPMYQAEAMWLGFGGGILAVLDTQYPCAIKIAAGNINAVSGKTWEDALSDQPQDYVTTPGQPWLDGFAVQKGLVRQFVAMPLGEGYTAEEQITGGAEHGGLQIVVYPMKRERYEAIRCKRPRGRSDVWFKKRPMREIDCQRSEMGLAPGGLMRQKIYQDFHGIDAWDQSNPARCFVHILNSTQWKAATGQPSPGTPPSSADYAKAGLPWFEYYSDGLAALDGTESLAQLDSVAALGVKKGQKPLPENEPATPLHVVTLGPGANVVHEGRW